MNRQPLVSVLTPSFNQGTWLEDNLRSVSNQTYSNVQHVVMDGGSTDRTVENLRAAGARVIWRSEYDRGQSHALNKAFELSEGEIIGWINSDDAYADVNAISKVVDVFMQNPDVGVVYGQSLLIDSTNHVLQCNPVERESATGLKLADSLIQPSVFFRRAVIQPPLVNESLRYVMDLDLWLRLSPTTRFKAIPFIVAVDRHQVSRKTLDGDYPAELQNYTLQLGISYTSMRQQIPRKLRKVLLRLRGVPVAWNLADSLTPAITLKVPNRRRLLFNQVLVPRRFMHVHLEQFHER